MVRNKLRVLPFLICLGAVGAGTLPLEAGTIGTYTVNAEFNTAGCPYTGNPSDRNPYACPAALPPGPYIIDLPAGDYEITLTSGVPGNDYIWDGDASSGISFAAPNVLGASEDFIHSAGPIALYWYDWYPYDNDPTTNSTFQISTVPQTPEPGTWTLVITGLAACAFGRFRPNKITLLNRRWLPWFLMFVTSFLSDAATITPYNFTEIATCIGSFTSGCTVQKTSSGAPITNSGTVSSSGENVTYTASSVSVPGSLGGVVSLNSDTINSSGPGIVADALEQVVDSVTVSYGPLDGQTGFMALDYVLEGTNGATGIDAGATFGGHGVPYACVKLGINNPVFPFGCTAYDQSSLDGTFSSGVFAFTYGAAFPLWFQLESIAGTGFGSGRPTGLGSSDASFYNTASINGLVLYDQNMNQVSGSATITSALGISYQDLSATPEPSTAMLFLIAGGAYLYIRGRVGSLR
jgi:hypothetical protein